MRDRNFEQEKKHFRKNKFHRKLEHIIVDCVQCNVGPYSKNK